MNRRELISMIAAVLASTVLPAFPEPVSLPALPLVLPFKMGPLERKDGQLFANIIVDTKQFKADFERLKVALAAGLISTADIQERLNNGTLVRIVAEGKA